MLRNAAESPEDSDLRKREKMTNKDQKNQKKRERDRAQRSRELNRGKAANIPSIVAAWQHCRAV